MWGLKNNFICIVLISLIALDSVESFSLVSTSLRLRRSGGFETFNDNTRSTTSLNAIEAVAVCKDQLLSMLSAAPSGIPTPKGMTLSILSLVQQLELKCPTPDDLVIPSLQGSWELLWTAQDMTSPEAHQSFFQSFITPLENQSYSNNPEGQFNPFLPLPLQKQLQRMGVPISATPVRSTQAIDLKNGLIRNIVALNIGGRNQRNDNTSELGDGSSSSGLRETSASRTFPSSSSKDSILRVPSFLIKPTRASVSVKIGCTPTPSDPRRVDVKFQSFRFSVPGTPIDMEMPLGAAGPTGWLRTVYIDEDLRISRGHKGSVFVLSRPRRASV